jgi:chromate transporter
VSACLPYWQLIQRHPRIAAVMKGVNAAVVGLLAAALVNLLQLGTILSAADLGLVALAILLLTKFRTPPILVVLICAASGAAITRFA